MFDQFIIPPNQHHTELLNVFLVVSLLIFIPFSGMVLGASFFSVIYNYLGHRSINKIYLRFSRELMDKLTIGKNAGWGLALIPLLSIMFVYAQLLYGASNLTMGTLIAATVMLAAGMVFIYRYKNTMKIESIVSSFKTLIRTKSSLSDDDLSDEVKEYEENTLKLNKNNALLGIFLFGLATFLIHGAMVVAADPAKWGMTFMSLFISGDATISWLLYLSFAGAITGCAILFFFFFWQDGIKDMTDEYRAFVKRFAVSLSMISILTLMLLMVVTLFTLPKGSLSGSVFVYTGLALFAILMASNFIYGIFRNSKVNYAAAAFAALILFVFFIAFRDQAALGNSLRPHLQSVYAKADEIEQEKISKVSSLGSNINAEQIYTQKCNACHSLDKKMVGPAHKDVVPKYNGDVKKLADYIYNPTKVDASYPPMPNQGLKPKEAEALAKYLIEKVK